LFVAPIYYHLFLYHVLVDDIAFYYIKYLRYCFNVVLESCQ